MPGQTISIVYGLSGKDDPLGLYSASTDNKGHFSFDEKIPNNQELMSLYVITTDSGIVSNDKVGTHMKLVLN